MYLQGPYQMLFSWKSPLICRGLNLFCRILYASPCYIYIVSALASQNFMAIPVVYFWSGYFPAALPESVLIVLIAYAVMSSVIKYYVRPGRNVLHDVRYLLLHQSPALVLLKKSCWLAVRVGLVFCHCVQCRSHCLCQTMDVPPVDCAYTTGICTTCIKHV